ncbi:MAG: hypothetical protein AAF921_01430 [Cyanobacteria bacterium P01_D01_bin.44]
MPPKKVTAPENDSSTSKVRLWVKPARTQKLGWRIGTLLGLGATATLAGFVIWSGVRLIIDPYSPNWLTTVVPALGNPEKTPLLTMAEIKADLPAGMTAGEPVLWKSGKTPSQSDRTPEASESDWIIPIFQTQQRCRGGAQALTPTGGCATIVELQVYRGAGGDGTRFKLVNQITVRGPKESFVTSPLIGTAAEVAGVDHTAALTTVKLLDQPLEPQQPWISLEGTRKVGSLRVRYGQLVHYAPRSGQLTPLLAWTSGAGKQPFFQALDEEGPDELMIDQTVGLEPKLQAYQVIANRPPQLKEISLRRTVFKDPPATSLYDKALLLANSGGWSHALPIMQSAKKALGDDWSPAAEAQLKLIGAHAQLTQAQADRTWSSQRQQLLADLIDGRWETALKQTEASPATYAELLNLLKTHFPRLWPRVEAHLKAHPRDEAVQMWGAILLTARQTPDAGKDWLEKQSQPKVALARWQTLSDRVDQLARFTMMPQSNAAIPVSAFSPGLSSGTSLDTGRYQQLFGSLSPVSAPRATPDPDWLFPDATVPRIEAGQTWYHINIQSLSGDRGWLPVSAANFSTTATANALWNRLGLAAQQRLQVISPSQGNLSSLTVQGIKSQGQSLTLLASGPVGLPTDAMVMTQANLQWLPLAASTSLADFLRTSPGSLEEFDQLAALLNLSLEPYTDSTFTDSTFPNLPDDSEDGSEDSPPDSDTHDALAQQLLVNYPQMQVARLDVTGDGASELVLTLPSPGAGSQTMIFEPTGSLVYSDLNQSQQLSAVVVSDAPAPSALLINQGGGYRLQPVSGEW